MSDATVRLQLFPRLISKMSKQKHLAGPPKISISQLHKWLPDQEGWWHHLKWRLSPRGRVSSRKRKDGKRKEETQEGGALSFLLALMVPNFSRPLPPVVFSSGHKLLYLKTSREGLLGKALEVYLNLKSRSSMKLKDASRARHGPMQPELPTELQQPQEKLNPRLRCWNFSRASSCSSTMP